ncbi:hypothetical protein ACFPM0_26525 [Pseudonocardia sulfidoxydans]
MTTELPPHLLFDRCENVRYRGSHGHRRLAPRAARRGEPAQPGAS